MSKAYPFSGFKVSCCAAWLSFMTCFRRRGIPFIPILKKKRWEYKQNSFLRSPKTVVLSSRSCLFACLNYENIRVKCDELQVISFFFFFFQNLLIEEKFSLSASPVCQLGVSSIQWQICDRPSCWNFGSTLLHVSIHRTPAFSRLIAKWRLGRMYVYTVFLQPSKD